MYTDGFSVAIVVGVIALLLPAAWVAWWLMADLGEGVNRPASEGLRSRFGPVA